MSSHDSLSSLQTGYRYELVWTRRRYISRPAALLRPPIGSTPVHQSQTRETNVSHSGNARQTTLSCVLPPTCRCVGQQWLPWHGGTRPPPWTVFLIV